MGSSQFLLFMLFSMAADNALQRGRLMVKHLCVHRSNVSHKGPYCVNNFDTLISPIRSLQDYLIVPFWIGDSLLCILLLKIRQLNYLIVTQKGTTTNVMFWRWLHLTTSLRPPLSWWQILYRRRPHVVLHLLVRCLVIFLGCENALVQ